MTHPASSPDTYDLLVLGGGSGGMAMARRARQYGARVLVIESRYWGGTCVNVGCVPKKVMWYAAEYRQARRCGTGWGLPDVDDTLDFAHLCAQREAYITRLRAGYQQRMQQDGIDYVDGHGVLLEPGLCQVGDRLFRAKQVLLATGARPIVPQLPGANLGWTSDDFFASRQLPARVAVVGGGYIAAELASLLLHLGAETSWLQRGKHALRGFDHMLGEQLNSALREDGLNLLTESRPLALRSGDQGLSLEHSGGVLHDLDAVIWAIGRAANSDAAGWNALGITCDEQGFVQVDEGFATDLPGHYALGDVTRMPALTPAAIAVGRWLADRLFAGKKVPSPALDRVPTAVFSHPPMATVGWSEAEARQHFTDVRIYQSRFTPMRYALSGHGTQSTIKLVCAGENERVLGCHMIGCEVDEILQGVAVAVQMGACKADFDATLAIHPSSSEELVLM